MADVKTMTSEHLWNTNWNIIGIPLEYPHPHKRAQGASSIVGHLETRLYSFKRIPFHLSSHARVSIVRSPRPARSSDQSESMYAGRYPAPARPSPSCPRSLPPSSVTVSAPGTFSFEGILLLVLRAGLGKLLSMLPGRTSSGRMGRSKQGGGSLESFPVAPLGYLGMSVAQDEARYFEGRHVFTPSQSQSRSHRGRCTLRRTGSSRAARTTAEKSRPARKSTPRWGSPS